MNKTQPGRKQLFMEEDTRSQVAHWQRRVQLLADDVSHLDKVTEISRFCAVSSRAQIHGFLDVRFKRRGTKNDNRKIRNVLLFLTPSKNIKTIDSRHFQIK